MSEPCISFNDYDKMTDILLWFSREVSLRFSVILSTKRMDGTRQSFHKEFEYDSKYNNTKLSRMIRRDINCFLTIDVRDDFENSVMIGYSSIIMLQLKLDEVLKWFSTLFKVVEGKLHIVGKYKNQLVTLDFNKCIEFEPIVIEYDDGKCCEGVRMYINSKLVYVDIPIDKFMAWYYIIKNFNMYQSASTMINYLGRPDPNTEYIKPQAMSMGDGSNSFFNKV